MSDWVDYEYAEVLSRYYPRYEKVRANPLKINFRCPICGDSASDELKARAWIFDSPKKGMLLFHCFNCDATSSFSNFLKEQDDALYREYILEKRKSDMSTAPVRKPIDEHAHEKFKTKLIIEKLDYCERLDRLDPNHPIIKYVEQRCIPKTAYSRLWFTSQWQDLVNSVNEDTYSLPKGECRLVIPIYNKDGKMEAFQGRALSANQQPKYLTIKASDNASKVYGCDKVNENEPVIVVEGPIDSLFLNNGIAITGGSLDLTEVPYEGNRIWVLDNEPRHPDTMKRMKKLIESNETVAMWDECPWSSKDINEMVKAGEATPEQINQYIIDNAVEGLMAKLRFSKWCRVVV